MGRAKSLGAWKRREVVLAGCLPVGVAVFALAGPLDAPWLRVAGPIFAVAGAVASLILVVGRTRLEGKREQAQFDRRIRVRIAPVREIDPTLIGVDAAAQDILPGKQLPDYVNRDVDDDLQAAVREALDGTGHWIVVALGTSKIGKSRAIFQALLQCAPAVELLAPVSGDALRSLLTPGETPSSHDRRCILWLDDLEPFLDQDVTFQTLREWHAEEPGRIVVATLGGKGSDTVTDSGSGKLATTAGDVLQNASQVGMKATTPGEIGPLRSRVSAEALASIERHGLAAYLVAASLLEQKLLTEIHAVGEPRCPEGAAVVYAAIDWARCGRTDSITDDKLRKLWDSYLSSAADATDDGFKTGLNWALRPVAGTIALIQRAASYRAYDYIVQAVSEQAYATPPHDAAWAIALDGVADAQALTVGRSAYVQGRVNDAIGAVKSASRSSTNEVAVLASYNLGVALSKAGHVEEAIVAYDEVVKRFGEAPELALRAQAAQALINKGVALDRLARFEEELSAYDEIATRFGDAPELQLREKVAQALFNRGVALGGMGRSVEELRVYEEVVARFGDAPELPLREQAAKALINEGGRLRALHRFDEELKVYGDVVARFGGAPELSLREPVAIALFNKGVTLGGLGRSEEAIGAFDEAIALFVDAPERALHEIAIIAAQAKSMLTDAEGS